MPFAAGAPARTCTQRTHTSHARDGGLAARRRVGVPAVARRGALADACVRAVGRDRRGHVRRPRARGAAARERSIAHHRGRRDARVDAACAALPHCRHSGARCGARSRCAALYHLASAALQRSARHRLAQSRARADDETLSSSASASPPHCSPWGLPPPCCARRAGATACRAASGRRPAARAQGMCTVLQQFPTSWRSSSSLRSRPASPAP
jgi:hypothetical protein